jgi:predicted O-methyltransferase YrrM
MISKKSFIEVRDTFSTEHSLVDIQGWLKPIEQQALHALAALTNGPVLEVGSWIGRSTVCLGRGLLLRKDRQPTDKVVCVELNPDVSYFRPNDEGCVEFWCPGDTAPRGHTTAEIYEEIVLPAISFPGGLVGKLKQTLSDHNLTHLADIVVGDVAEVLPVNHYGLIFSDISHTPYEIEKMVAGMAPVIQAGTILACHDTTPQNRKALEGAINYEWTEMCGSLHIGLIGD